MRILRTLLDTLLPSGNSATTVDEPDFLTPAGDFDDWRYLHAYRDVALAVRNGSIPSGQHHFENIGHQEIRAGKRPRPMTLREESYLLRNPDVKAAVEAGVHKGSKEHWNSSGRSEEESGKRKPYISTASKDVSEWDLSSWRDGYVILPGIFDSARCDNVIEAMNRLWRDRANVRLPIDIDIFLNDQRSGKVPICDAPEDAFAEPLKINNLYYWMPEVRNLVLDERLCRVLRFLLDGDPVALTSLNFRKGSEQGLHLDTFYMPPRIPHRMVAAWVALEDLNEGNGPLRYVPGSNRIPPCYFDGHRLAVNHSKEEYELFGRYYTPKLQERALPVKEFQAKKGDVLIWHALLYHGGSPILNKESTRYSIAAHFFAAADYPLGTATGATNLIQHAYGCFYEDRAPSVKATPLASQLSFRS